MRLEPDTPLFSALINELVQARDEALQRAAQLESTLTGTEALHEPDADGECPTCRCPAPCVTHLLIRGEIDLARAFAAVRDQEPIDLVRHEADHRPVPSLASMLQKPSPHLDRFFDALLNNAS